MVDMGSLENIESSIHILNDVKIGIMNNVSTSIALNIGHKMMQNMAIETILSDVKNSFVFKYKIIDPIEKEDIILFTSDQGIDVSTQFMMLFRDSLPKTVKVKLMEYDYNQLVSSGGLESLLKKYNVVLLIKPYLIHFKGMNEVSIEDMMNSNGVNKVNKVLSKYLNEEEIERFNAKFIENFSLQSVTENITILNPNILMESVSNSLNILQNKMDIKFSNKALLGLYIHTCLMIERLVTKTNIQISKETGQFESEHSDFIKMVEESFDEAKKKYNIHISTDEHMQIYEYIQNDQEYIRKNKIDGGQ